MTSSLDALGSTPSRHPAIETAEVLDRVVLFDDRDAGVHELNESASLVWLAVDGSTSVGAMADRLGERVGRSVTDEVVAAVEEFDRLGLLRDASPFAVEPGPLHGDRV
ncbi:hypothetical protein GCM10022415_31840 [Knoellia locipacati]|uniref:PqqD family protein n=1 Tax=Knoellia locipacati TaxID=882824 RepID=A0A512T3N5_9MICO|nr:PqqD family protein [Knoellia locipacati]GEQ14812.1 hypothetical protein KLO01_28590 [Knoellia locipacati]